MITFFSIPRAFKGGDKRRQENALGSWTRLDPRPQIILCCDDPGVAEAAEAFDCIHVPDVRCNNKGVPYVGDAFRRAAVLADNDILCFTNADIIFLQDVIKAARSVDQHFDEPYLIIGQRWDLSLPQPLEYTEGWQQRLRGHLKQLHAPTAMDYFIFPKGTISNLPDFLVGSPRWDNWLVANARRRGLQIIDATEAITCIHQTHRHVWTTEGIRYNQKMWERAGGGAGYTHSSTWVLGRDGKLISKKTKSDFDCCIKTPGSPDIFMVRNSSMTRVRIGYWGAYVAMGKPPISVVTWAEMNNYRVVEYFRPE